MGFNSKTILLIVGGNNNSKPVAVTLNTIAQIKNKTSFTLNLASAFGISNSMSKVKTHTYAVSRISNIYNVVVRNSMLYLVQLNGACIVPTF